MAILQFLTLVFFRVFDQTLFFFPQGHTPLQLVQTAIRNDEEELTSSDSQNSESLLSLRRRVAVLLRDAMTKKKRKSLQRGSNKGVAENRNRLMFEDFPDSEDMNVGAGFEV